MTRGEVPTGRPTCSAALQASCRGSPSACTCSAPARTVPNFVYGIFVSIFVLFNCFAVNQLLQYRAIGRWADYLFGERIYVWLSLTAKSLLAWQIFANVLVS